jgi:penicillin-binding protein 1A
LFFLKKLAKIAAILLSVALIVMLIAYIAIKDQLPSVDSLKNVKWQTPMQIYSADGQLMNQFGETKRIPLQLEEMPEQLIKAILATEDDRFYLHFGVDPIGMSRAILGQLMGQNKGGASTITMQVARNFFLTREVTYIRKLREIFTAFHIERLLTKDEILALYMNKIPLGHRAFGFGAAAQVYYNKDVKDLTLAQIAVLAGLPKAPSTINPIRSPERAKARRAVVLYRMLVSGYITEEQYREANSAPITAQKHGAEIQLSAPYVAEMAHQEAVELLGREEAYTGGYKVFTTVSSELQSSAQRALKTNLKSYDQRHGYRGALTNIAIEQQSENSDTAQLQIEEISEESIKAALNNTPIYESLEVAVVTQVLENSAFIRTKEGQFELTWQGLSWARAFINDEKQGKAPQIASEILTIGDVIYVELIDDQYVLSQLPEASAAIVSLKTDNGAIEAAVGGFSFSQSQFNRVTQAKRQVGSNIKPFVYSAALEHGFTLASLVNDAPINQWDRKTGVVWRPKNSPAVYNGPIRVREALARSKNVVAVRLLREVGLDNMVNHLSNFGFAPDELPRDESLALGSASLTPLEIATGFAVFANGGYYVEPYIIDKIEDSFGNVVYKHQPAKVCSAVLDYEVPEAEQNKEVVDKHCAPRVISEQNAFLITQALNSAIWDANWSAKPPWQATGWRARTLKRRDLSGKTGTTNEAKDAWFSGYSRRLITTSWIGFDDHTRNLGRSVANPNLGKNQITGNEFGARSAQPAWISFMKDALTKYPYEPFEQPENMVSVRIDKQSGKLSQTTDKSSIFEYFKLGTAPTEYVTTDNSEEILHGNNQEESEIF